MGRGAALRVGGRGSAQSLPTHPGDANPTRGSRSAAGYSPASLRRSSAHTSSAGYRRWPRACGPTGSVPAVPSRSRRAPTPGRAARPLGCGAVDLACCPGGRRCRRAPRAVPHGPEPAPTRASCGVVGRPPSVSDVPDVGARRRPPYPACRVSAGTAPATSGRRVASSYVLTRGSVAATYGSGAERVDLRGARPMADATLADRPTAWHPPLRRRARGGRRPRPAAACCGGACGCG